MYHSAEHVYDDDDFDLFGFHDHSSHRDHEVDEDEWSSAMQTSTWAGTAAGGVLLLLLILCCCRRRRNRGQVLAGPAVVPPPPPGHVSYPQQQYIVEVPTAYSVVPAQNTAYQQFAPYPTQGTPYPTHGATYPAQGAPYPTQGSPYPPQGAPYPTQGAPYTTQGTPYTTEGTPYAAAPSAPDASALPPTYEQAVSATDKSSPYNPQVPH